MGLELDTLGINSHVNWFYQAQDYFTGVLLGRGDRETTGCLAGET